VPRKAAGSRHLGLSKAHVGVGLALVVFAALDDRRQALVSENTRAVGTLLLDVLVTPRVHVISPP
jgi:hypothetical protein